MHGALIGVFAALSAERQVYEDHASSLRIRALITRLTWLADTQFARRSYQIGSKT